MGPEPIGSRGRPEDEERPVGKRQRADGDQDMTSLDAGRPDVMGLGVASRFKDRAQEAGLRVGPWAGHGRRCTDGGKWSISDSWHKRERMANVEATPPATIVAEPSCGPTNLGHLLRGHGDRADVARTRVAEAKAQAESAAELAALQMGCDRWSVTVQPSGATNRRSRVVRRLAADARTAILSVDSGEDHERVRLATNPPEHS